MKLVTSKFDVPTGTSLYIKLYIFPPHLVSERNEVVGPFSFLVLICDPEEALDRYGRAKKSLYYCRNWNQS